ncbi:toprim domain-containing protein [Marinagarivorans algicola]|uniref:toprim domain-containing protein n=1 Tax=Marinagarivorans algicola TaxID=1513270 RepID=UPI0009EC7069|nr:toprim domain-containing protein [Marinagarivorans algicola]
MARFSDDTIQQLKGGVSLMGLVEAGGITLKAHGKDKIGHCPFHDDKTPSLVISPESNLWHCLGACQTGGSVIDWVMKMQGVSFRHAVEILNSDASAAAPVKPIKQSTTKKLDALLSGDTEAQQLLNQVTEYYHDTLKQSPEALQYLESRGLGDAELIDRFKLGYANRTLAYRLPEKNRKAGAAIRGKLQEVGILRSTGHEHLTGSVVVPIFDSEGNVCELYGRKILGQRLRKGTAQHLYLPGPHAGVWNIEGLHNQPDIILCEALIDAMTFWVNGYKNVTASYGTSGFTTDHLAAFKASGAKRILIAYDRDEAGNNAAQKLAEQLQQEGFACYRLNFPKGMDANQYALEVTPADKSLGVVIRSAELMLGAPMMAAKVMNSAVVEPVKADEKSLPLAANAISSVAPNILPPVQALPDAPSNDVHADVTDKEISFTFGNRKYRVRGLDKNKNYEALKINLLANVNEQIHVDTFDIYAAKHRHSFIKLAAIELALDESTVKKDVGKILLKLEALQEQLIQNALEKPDEKTVLAEDDKAQALALLQDPNLLNRILTDFSRCGVVGEESNKLVGYLAAGSRKLERPLAVIIQSTSAAGKSSLMDAVLNLMPENERVQYSAMTGQSLFYMGETNLKNKILAIAEEEGASNASYALKLLQSEGEITIASTGKDDTTGNLVTKEYKVQGPVMLFLTTTAIDIDEELLNRCLVLTVNESREQTQAIHRAQRQRRTLAGLQSKLEKEQLVKLHRNAQSLLRPLAIINPYADQLTFLDDKTRTRRDHEKYLTLIDSIALLHQYQREIKTVMHNGKALEYIEAQLSDIETANKLAHEVLGRTLDELPAQTRKLLKLIQSWVADECEKQSLAQSDYRFSRREIREVIRWSDTALKVHIARLVELEYLLVHRGRGGRFDYELLFDGNDEQRLMGLINVEKLQCDANRSGQKSNQSGGGQPLVRVQPAPSNTPQPSSHNALSKSEPLNPNAQPALKNDNASHRSAMAVPA